MSDIIYFAIDSDYSHILFSKTEEGIAKEVSKYKGIYNILKCEVLSIYEDHEFFKLLQKKKKIREGNGKSN